LRVGSGKLGKLGTKWSSNRSIKMTAKRNGKQMTAKQIARIKRANENKWCKAKSVDIEGEKH